MILPKILEEMQLTFIFEIIYKNFYFVTVIELLKSLQLTAVQIEVIDAVSVEDEVLNKEMVALAEVNLVSNVDTRVSAKAKSFASAASSTFCCSPDI